MYQAAIRAIPNNFHTLSSLNNGGGGGRGGRGRWGLEGICKYIFDVSFVQFYLYSEFLLNFVLKSMLGKGKGQAKARNKEVNS